MRPTQFKIESLGCEIFDGFTKGENWNGWNCPYFTFEQAQKVLQIYNELGQIVGQKNPAYYDELINAFVFPSNDKDEPEMFEAVTENNQKFYPVGAFSWIWEEQN